MFQYKLCQPHTISVIEGNTSKFCIAFMATIPKLNKDIPKDKNMELFVMNINVKIFNTILAN